MKGVWLIVLCLEWIDLAQVRDSWRAQLVVAQNAGNFLTSLGPVNCKRRAAALIK